MKFVRLKVFILPCIFAVGFTASMAQEGGFSVPPELNFPPEHPVNHCDFEFKGYGQPSQGVYQDDPVDKNLLKTLKEKAKLKDLYHPPPNNGQYSLPTYEGLIDMVAGRDTYLIGATPRDRNDNPDGNDAFKEVENIVFKYTTAFDELAKVQARVSVYNNNVPVAQFMLTKTPIDIPLKGDCRYRSGYYGENTIKIPFSDGAAGLPAVPFRFSHPGKYLIRTELVYHDQNQQDISKLYSTGIAFDIIGNVVQTLTPALYFYPLYPANATAAQQNAFKNDVVQNGQIVAGSLKKYLPVPNGSAPLGVSSTFLTAGDFDDFYQLAQAFSLGHRLSSPFGGYDRVVVVAEKDVYEDLLEPLAFSLPKKGRMICFGGANWNKNFLFLQGMDLAGNLTVPAVGLAKNTIHEILHSLGPKSWAPNSPNIDDCAVEAYHYQYSHRGLAFGVLPGSTEPYFYGQKKDIMQRSKTLDVPGEFISQCTYRHALDELSKTLIDPPVIMVSGYAWRQGLFSHSAHLLPLYQTDGFIELDEQGFGSWHILLKDDQGVTLADYPFEPQFPIEDFSEPSEALFNYTVPDLPGVRRVEVTTNGLSLSGPTQILLDAIDYSTYPPVVFDFQANLVNGEYQAQWAAYDFDGDPLLASLLVSEDGDFYTPTQFFEITGSQASLKLPAAVSHLKLVITDGARSVQRILAL